LADLLEPGLRRAFDAADAAWDEVTLGGALRCERAEPAADLVDLLDESLLSTFDAADEALFDVTSDLLAIAQRDKGDATLIHH
jgi:hypothetical protein